LQCFHRLFEATARSAPAAVAIEFGDAVMSYDELNRHANRLAHHLISVGVRPDTPVGVSVARSPGTLMSILAIAKAGGAYVPIDPGEREERRTFLAADSGIRALVTDGGAWPEGIRSELTFVDLSTDASTMEGACDRDPESGVGLGHLAYIVYTSGSTGRPKGTAMEHGALANLLAWHGSIRRPSCGLRTLQFCSVGFDFSFHEIFSTLCFGGTLVMADEEALRDPFVLARLIRDRAIEKLFLPVSALAQWAAAVDEPSFPNHLKHVVTSGEQLQITPTMRAIFARTGASLHNHYGATEFQDATTLTLSGDPEGWPLLPPVGRPLANAT
jgi:non-ribosomal peptide synthetase component F